MGTGVTSTGRQPRPLQLLCRDARKRLLCTGGAVIALAALMPWRVGVVLGSSMAPTMTNHQVYLLDRGPFRKQPILRGDVVVFEHDGRSYIKRVVAVGGDHLTLLRFRGSTENTVVPEWQLSSVRRLARSPRWRATFKVKELQVPEGEYFVVGDNSNASYDSCHFGPIPAGAIRGKVLPAPPDPEPLRMAGTPRSPRRL